MSLPSEVARPVLVGLEAVVGAEGFAAPGAGGRRRTAVSSYLTGWLAGHWGEATDGADPAGVALVVLGSVGRGEAGPHSDVVIIWPTR